MENPPNLQRAADLISDLRDSIHTTFWSYSAQLNRLKLFKKGHGEDTRSLSVSAHSNPSDQNLQRMAENGSQGIGYLDLLLTELEGYSARLQGFIEFLDEVELQLGLAKTDA